MVDVRKLEIELRAMTSKEVREYALKHYPDLYFFRSGSKDNNISKIITHEDNSNVLDMIGRVASK